MIPRSPLDSLLDRVLECTYSLEESLRALYGPVTVCPDSVQHVYTDGSSIQQADGSRRGGAGVYWGYACPRNIAAMAPSPGTNNCAELYAILLCVAQADPQRVLRIYTDSEHAIRSVCHWAPKSASMGWRCANAEIIRNIVSLIRRRTAPVEFIWVKGHAGNTNNEEADRLARTAAS
ncbi:ribonuclease H-like domain-containing protein, partial [Rhodofomes roseus]